MSPPKSQFQKKTINIIDKIPDERIYCNHVQVILTNNELFLDYFFINPRPGQTNTTDLDIKPIIRIIAPVSMAKGLSSALSSIVADYEADTNIILPSSKDIQA